MPDMTVDLERKLKRRGGWGDILYARLMSRCTCTVNSLFGQRKRDLFRQAIVPPPPGNTLQARGRQAW